MDEQKNENLEYELADVIVGKQHPITLGRKQLSIYPVTLAKVLILKRYVEALDINHSLMKVSPYAEALRLVAKDKQLCSSIVAIHTCPNSGKDFHDRRTMVIRRNIVMSAPDGDVATLLALVLASDKTEALTAYCGIDREQERLRKVMQTKAEDSKNNLTFGGLTVFGNFIGQLKEMGYTDDEILYERPYTFLRLMLADKVTTVYLTDDELNRLPVGTMGNRPGAIIDGNDPEAFDRLRARLAGKGLNFQ